jgi:beta-1,4-mannosyltransferase
MRALFFPVDRANPYQRSLAQHLAGLGVHIEGRRLRWRFPAETRHADVAHVHWTSALSTSEEWKFVLGYPSLGLQLILLRLRGQKVIWTVHNLEQHERSSRVRDWLISLLIGHLANALIVHGESAAKAVRRRLMVPRRKIAVIPHGNYIDCYPNEVGRGEARRRLDLGENDIVGLFLGHIRPYKGVEGLIEVFGGLKKDRVALVLAGRPINEEIERRVARLAERDRRVRFHPGFVEDDRVQLFMNASDFVVFPYRDVLTSGAVVLAMSFGKACVAPRLGCIADTLDEQGAFLYDPANPEGLASALRMALTAADHLSEMGRYNRRRAEQWSWDRIAAATLAVYEGRRPVKAWEETEAAASDSAALRGTAEARQV